MDQLRRHCKAVSFTDAELEALNAAKPKGIKLAVYIRRKALQGVVAERGWSAKANALPEAAAAAECSALLHYLLDRLELGAGWVGDSKAEVERMLKQIQASFDRGRKNEK